MTAVASPAWLSAELAYINNQAHERLEEFAFYVAEDIDWLNEYTRSIVDNSNADVFDVLKTPGRLKQARTPFKDVSNLQVVKLPIGKERSITPTIEPAASEQEVVVPAESVPLESNEDEASMEISLDDVAAPAQIVQAVEEPIVDIQLNIPVTDRPQTAQTNDSEPNWTRIGSSSSAESQPMNDYMEPINLKSPPKRGPSRADSAYFSAAESPVDESSRTSERQSVAFASLPPRQPFAKKSLGHRSSQLRSSVYDAAKVKTPLKVKLEPEATPQISQPQDIYQVKRERFSEQMSALTERAQLDAPAESVILENVPGTDNPFDVSKAIPPPAETEEDEWLPKFDKAMSNSPKKSVESLIPTKTPVAAKKAPIEVMPAKSVAKSTPGAIRAAMQAASAKATSYLKTARTAFGSPSSKHDRVFPSTTPMQSPPKRFAIKPEPQTPALYPEIRPIIETASMIPSKTPRKSPLKQMETIVSPRKSPRKGEQAALNMAAVAAKNALAQAHDEPADVASPPKKAKVVPKLLAMPKSKPLSIRVATASQREIPKDRKVLPEPTLSKSTSEDSQLDYLSRSQSLVSKKLPQNKQIRALAAANQAKEKQEKEQERRDQQRKEIERRRQENIRRLAEEEERRKQELRKQDEERKRKALDARKKPLPTPKRQLSEIHDAGAAIIVPPPPSKKAKLPVSEEIELPEIPSDYSDSEDDLPGPNPSFTIPQWAASPDLRRALRQQQKIDPDTIFGPIGALQVDEIWKGKERALARVRGRSSSVNWERGDKLSAEEVAEYARQMGYR